MPEPPSVCRLWQSRALRLLHPSGHWHYLEECREESERWSYWREIGDWLSKFHWQHFITFTFADPVSDVCAERAVRSFHRRLGGSAYGFLGPERGHTSGLVHCHSLFGGLEVHGREAEQKEIWAKWNHGDIHHTKYDPRRGAAFYVSKNAWRSVWGGFIGPAPELHSGPTRRRRRKRRR